MTRVNRDRDTDRNYWLLRDRPFIQLYDPSVNYRQLRAQIESNQQITSANNTISGQGSGRGDRNEPITDNSNSQENESHESASSGDEFSRIVTQAHRKSNQVSKQVLEIQKFKDLTEFEQGHPKWAEEIEESLSPCMMDKLKDISKNLGVLSVLIFIRLHTFFKKCETVESDKASKDVREAHE